jgi:hypothetical protein
MTHERTERPADCLRLPGPGAPGPERNKAEEISDGGGRALVTVPHRAYARVMRFPMAAG